MKQSGKRRWKTFSKVSADIVKLPPGVPAFACRNLAVVALHLLEVYGTEDSSPETFHMAHMCSGSNWRCVVPPEDAACCVIGHGIRAGLHHLPGEEWPRYAGRVFSGLMQMSMFQFLFGSRHSNTPQDAVRRISLFLDQDMRNALETRMDVERYNAKLEARDIVPGYQFDMGLLKKFANIEV